MLVEVSYLLKFSDTQSYKRAEIYDVASRAEAYDVICERYGKDNILSAEFKVIGCDDQASDTRTSESQSAMFADCLDA
jgi:hypothetical protein